MFYTTRPESDHSCLYYQCSPDLTIHVCTITDKHIQYEQPIILKMKEQIELNAIILEEWARLNNVKF